VFTALTEAAAQAAALDAGTRAAAAVFAVGCGVRVRFNHAAVSCRTNSRPGMAGDVLGGSSSGGGGGCASAASTGAECAACCLASEGCDASVWAAAPRTSLDLSQHAQQQQPPSNGQQQQQQQQQQGSCSLRAGFNRRHAWDGIGLQGSIGGAEGTVATESGGTTNHNSSATATATTTSGGTDNYNNSASERARARVSVAELEAERDRLCSSTDGADAGPHIAITIPVDPRNPLAGAELVCRDVCVADAACTHFATGRVTPTSSRETCFL